MTIRIILEEDGWKMLDLDDIEELESLYHLNIMTNLIYFKKGM